MAKVKIKSNTQVVVEYLKKNQSMTDIDATDTLGVRRLADVIFRLRNVGFGITTISHKGINRRGKTVNYGEYVLNHVPTSWNP